MRKANLLILSVLFTATVLAEEPPKTSQPNYWLPDLKPGLTTYDGKNVRLRLGSAIIYDYTFFDQDQESITQVGEQKDTDDLRAGRYVFIADLKFFPKPWTIFIGADFNEFRESGDRVFDGIDRYLIIPLWGNTKVSIGKQKETFVYEMVGDAANLPQQERILSPFFVSRNSGIKFYGTAASKRMSWSAGWFNNWLTNDIPFDENGNEFTGRITGLPILSADGTEYLHLGFAARYAGATEGKLRFKGRPESNISDNYIDTGSITADSASEIAFEGLYSHRGFSVLAELVPGLWVDSAETGDPHFFGYTIVGSWVLTGENRPYDPNVGYARRVIPKKDYGAWEIVARYSSIDVQNGIVDGGVLDKWYFGLNWWASKQWKFGIGYGIADLDKNGVTGRTNSVLIRSQWAY
jgi:phosphate-selective porin OprO/OprP